MVECSNGKSFNNSCVDLSIECAICTNFGKVKFYWTQTTVSTLDDKCKQNLRISDKIPGKLPTSTGAVILWIVSPQRQSPQADIFAPSSSSSPPPNTHTLLRRDILACPLLWMVPPIHTTIQCWLHVVIATVRCLSEYCNADSWMTKLCGASGIELTSP